MKADSNPVFLSYASQDAAAVARIAEALRAAGVEVWFDQNELTGGDAWDAKIRKQIKECALFVPVISANTQARLEGYFRREWKLAVERTHDMADGVPFLFPVVIDDTTDATARVPEKFREVQWTRLRLEETPHELAQRVAKILSQPAGSVATAESGSGRRPARASSRVNRLWVGVGLVFAVTYGTRPFWSGLRDNDPPRTTAATATGANKEAESLAAQAAALFEGKTIPMRSDFEAAEPLIARALALDDTNPEVWALMSRHALGMVAAQYDTSQERIRKVADGAERAIRLGPERVYARLAHATALTLQPAAWTEAEAALRRLAAEAPGDARIWRTLGLALNAYGRPAEAVVFFDRAHALPGGDPQSLFGKSAALRAQGDFSGAEACADELIRLDPASPALLQKLELLVRHRGDLERARELAMRIPARLSREQSAAVILFVVWLDLGEPDRAIAALEAVPRDSLQDHTFAGPKGYLVGYAHRLAGRADAARAEWQAALNSVEQRVAERANDAAGHLQRASLLACLGRKPEAEAALQLGEQLQGNHSREITLATDVIYLELGYVDEVLTYLEQSRRPDKPQILSHTPVALRMEPWWTPLRGHPRFEALTR
ncbi:MAG TPA: TIR domain-containing protein [Opitutaceae bacterium]